MLLARRAAASAALSRRANGLLGSVDAGDEEVGFCSVCRGVSWRFFVGSGYPIISRRERSELL